MYYQNNSMTCLQPKQVNLLCTIHRLWFEHVLWTRAFIMSTANNTGDLEFVTNRLLRNPVDFANVLKQLYDNQVAKKFETLFTDHLVIAAALVNAAKAGDTATYEEQRKKWYQNADDIAAFLGSINPYWSKNVWQAMMYEHLKITENEAVLILNQKYEESIVQYDEIQKQAKKMADEMAYGIIKQLKI